jgi:hypothetical protein
MKENLSNAGKKASSWISKQRRAVKGAGRWRPALSPNSTGSGNERVNNRPDAPEDCIPQGVGK